MSETGYQEKVLEVEPFGIEPIPGGERHGRARQMFTLWFATNLNIVTWFTGFLGVEFGLSVKYAILAIIIGNVLGAVFLGLTSAIGPELGQPLIPASRRSFGRAGVFGLSLLNLINNIGWLAVNLALAVLAVQKILPLGYNSALLLLTVVTLLIAVYGYNFIHSFAHWMSIVMGGLFVIITVVSLRSLPAVLQSPAAGGFNLGMFVLTIAIAFSYQISYCPIGSDYSRYFPQKASKKRVWLAAFLGSLSVCLWLEILGVLTAALVMQTHAGPLDFFAKLMGVFTVPALITVILSILPVNAMAIYSGGLAAMAMGIPFKRWASAIVCGGLGALLIAFGAGKMADTYKHFLLLLSYWIAPWLGVLLSDFFRKRTASAEGNGSNGWAGITAFIIGVLVSVPFMSSVLYVGPIAKLYLGGADISYFLSLVVSAVIYRMILKMTNSSVHVKASVPAAE